MKVGFPSRIGRLTSLAGKGVFRSQSSLAVDLGSAPIRRTGALVRTGRCTAAGRADTSQKAVSGEHEVGPLSRAADNVAKYPDGTANAANKPPGGYDPLIAANQISLPRAVM